MKAFHVNNTLDGKPIYNVTDDETLYFVRGTEITVRRYRCGCPSDVSLAHPRYAKVRARIMEAVSVCAAQKVAAEAIANDNIEVFMVAMSAADNAGATCGAQQPERATAEWLDCWRNTVSGLLIEGGKHVTPTTVAYYSERGIRA